MQPVQVGKNSKDPWLDSTVRSDLQFLKGKDRATNGTGLRAPWRDP